MTKKVGPSRKLLKKEIQDRFLKATKNGAKLRQACGYAGISYHTLRNLILIAEERDTNNPNENDEYIQFLRKYEEARAKRALKWVKVIEDSAPKNWGAAAWLLEKCEPKDYGSKSVEENATNNNEPAKVKSTTDDLAGAITRLLDTARERAIKEGSGGAGSSKSEAD